MANRAMTKSSFPRPDRRLFLVGASALALSACSGILGPPEAAQIYILKAASAAPVPGPKVDWALAIEIPTASEALDAQRIALTHSDTTLDYYANAVWPDSLPLMVQTAVLSAFQDGGRLAAVAREQDALHADYNLALDIRDFAAHYSTPDGAPRVTVTIIAQMATAHGRKVVANLNASQSAEASVNSVDAVVQALDTALGAVIAQITQWALALPPPSTVSTP
jgi:cholesterol transport system auxiliary component